ncbi:MAG: hypothetical protein ACTSWC_04915 [Promethearchaeota archaeon]
MDCSIFHGGNIPDIQTAFLGLSQVSSRGFLEWSYLRVFKLEEFQLSRRPTNFF